MFLGIWIVGKTRPIYLVAGVCVAFVAIVSRPILKAAEEGTVGRRDCQEPTPMPPASEDTPNKLTIIRRFQEESPIVTLGLADDDRYIVVLTHDDNVPSDSDQRASVWDFGSRKRAKGPQPVPREMRFLEYPGARFFRWRGLEESEIMTESKRTLDAAPYTVDSEPVAVSRTRRYLAIYTRRPLGKHDVTDLQIWDTRTGSEVSGWNGADRRYVTKACFSPSEQHLAVIGQAMGAHLLPDSNFLCLVNRLHGVLEIEPFIQDEGYRDYLHDVAYSPDGKFLVLCGGGHRRDGTMTGIVAVRSGSTYARLFEIRLKEELFAIAFSPDSRLLAAGDRKGHLLIWEIQKETWQLVRVAAHSHPIADLCFARDGHALVSGSQDGTIAVSAMEGAMSRVQDEGERPGQAEKR